MQQMRHSARVRYVCKPPQVVFLAALSLCLAHAQLQGALFGLHALVAVRNLGVGSLHALVLLLLLPHPQRLLLDVHNHLQARAKIKGPAKFLKYWQVYVACVMLLEHTVMSNSCMVLEAGPEEQNMRPAMTCILVLE